ncbi:MAG: beta-N-acetylglucosaminidase domain-containing protein [Anaerovibrio sp.]|uniref:protein O-GlcNAcase n=1 Tax=Anaerovibrio sp. TaxID=1872532 RepID=UPI0025E301E1|nr:protein O-GlcNAcase [Anaerovibrio sp.]MCR5176591.1 beta-N-acetylglucosaminidase domain-containing protein [Anaerovibrio sp.]
MRIKWILIVLTLFLSCSQIPLNAHADKAAPIKLRGVVEGFYGTPWTHQDRLDMLAFMASKGMNAYIYAPKDDEYHRKYWRQPYPAEKYGEIAELVGKAAELHIEFIFAVSPGNDIAFTGPMQQADRVTMLDKMEAMYRIGIRRFALFFDDIPTADAKGQAAFVNWINKEFVHAKGDCKPLILVPTEYYLRQMAPEGKASDYTAELAKGIDKDIMVLYTGEEVCPDGLTRKTIETTNKLYGKPLGIWWNYPVSDYLKEKLALGPVSDMDRSINSNDIAAFFINPMEKPKLSQIAIATGADYALNPADYDEDKAWHKAIKEQYGPLSEEMELFAVHSQRMENSWAHIGRQDAPELRLLYKKLWEIMSGQDNFVKRALLDKLLAENRIRDNAIHTLMGDLPRKNLDECRLQLVQLQKMTEAERYALLLLKEKKTSAEKDPMYRCFKDLKTQIEADEASVKISEEATGKFLRDFDEWYLKHMGDINKDV